MNTKDYDIIYADYIKEISSLKKQVKHLEKTQLRREKKQKMLQMMK